MIESGMDQPGVQLRTISRIVGKQSLAHFRQGRLRRLGECVAIMLLKRYDTLAGEFLQPLRLTPIASRHRQPHHDGQACGHDKRQRQYQYQVTHGHSRVMIGDPSLKIKIDNLADPQCPQHLKQKHGKQ